MYLRVTILSLLFQMFPCFAVRQQCFSKNENVFGIAGTYDPIFTMGNVSMMACASIAANREACTGFFYSEGTGQCDGTQFVSQDSFTNTTTDMLFYSRNVLWYETVGCYRDDEERVMQHIYRDHFHNPPNLECFNYCKTTGYPYFGRELTCFCGNKTYERLGGATNCDEFECYGDICGGNWAMQVYAITYGC